MLEMAKRERWNKVAEWELIVHAAGSLLGTNAEGTRALVTSMKKMLDDRLSHSFYDARTIERHLLDKIAELYRNKNLMDRLDSMAV